MKSIISQVDEFIEGLFDGSIITVLTRDVELKREATVPGYFASLFGGAKNLGESAIALFTKLTGDLIPRYISSVSNEKHTVALDIYYSVLSLRAAGFIQNNPSSLRELEFYKKENAELKEKKANLEGKVQDLSSELLASTPPPDKKVGVQ